MKKIFSLSLLSMALATGACDHYSEKMVAYESRDTRTAYYQNVSNIEPAAGGHAYLSGTTFKSHLKNEYMTLATYENNVRQDYKAAKYYTNKIEKLEDGQMVSPATFSDFNVQPELRGVLTEARADLIEAIQIFNIPENRYILAMAQSRYDCWMDQAEDRPELALSSACRLEFEQALDAVVTDSEYYDDGLFSL